MASLENRYAVALSRLAAEPGADAAALAKKLETHLKETGRSKLTPRIVAELGRIRERSRLTRPSIEVSSEGEMAAAQHDAKELGIDADVAIVPSLIRGWRVSGNGHLTDRTAKRALIDLYRSITART